MACSAHQQLIKTEYVKAERPELPKEPDYYPVSWQRQAGQYCLNEDNSKNLLKNMILLRGYQEELRLLLLP